MFDIVISLCFCVFIYFSLYLCLCLSLSVPLSYSVTLSSITLALSVSLSLSLSLSDTCNGETDVCDFCGNCSQCSRENAKKVAKCLLHCKCVATVSGTEADGSNATEDIYCKQTLKQSDNNYAASEASARMLDNTTWKANLRKHLNYEWHAEGTLLALEVSVSVNAVFWISVCLCRPSPRRCPCGAQSNSCEAVPEQFKLSKLECKLFDVISPVGFSGSRPCPSNRPSLRPQKPESDSSE